jgi:hypothetical protein
MEAMAALSLNTDSPGVRLGIDEGVPVYAELGVLPKSCNLAAEQPRDVACSHIPVRFGCGILTSGLGNKDIHEGGRDYWSG